MERYSSLSRDEVLGNIPMMFITFPSAKDPSSSLRHPGTHTHGTFKLTHTHTVPHELTHILLHYMQIPPLYPR